MASPLTRSALSSISFANVASPTVAMGLSHARSRKRCNDFKVGGELRCVANDVCDHHTCVGVEDQGSDAPNQGWQRE